MSHYPSRSSIRSGSLTRYQFLLELTFFSPSRIDSNPRDPSSETLNLRLSNVGHERSSWGPTLTSFLLTLLSFQLDFTSFFFFSESVGSPSRPRPYRKVSTRPNPVTWPEDIRGYWLVTYTCRELFCLKWNQFQREKSILHESILGSGRW